MTIDKQALRERYSPKPVPGIMASRLPASIVSNMINAEARRTQGVSDARTTIINDEKGNYTIRFAIYVGSDSTEVTSGIS